MAVETEHTLVSRRKLLGVAVAAIGGGILKVGLDKMQAETVGLGGGGGAINFRGLSDVDKNLSPLDNDILFFNRNLGRFTSEQVTVLTDPLYVKKTDLFDGLLPSRVGDSGEAKGTSGVASRSDHIHQLDTGRVLRTGDTMTGSLGVLRPGLGFSAFIASLNTDQVFRYNVFPDGTTEWGNGAAARDVALTHSAVGVLQVLRNSGVGMTGIEVAGTEAGAGTRRFSENTSRAVIQDGVGAHLNDIEKTRFSPFSPFNTVAAASTVLDTAFRVPAGKKLKIWFISSVTGSGAVTGQLFIQLQDVSNNVLIRSFDAFANSTGDPSTNIVDTTYQPAGAGAFNVYLQRQNTNAKTAFSFSGLWVLSIE